MKCVVGHGHILDWSILWDDFTQEEIREGSHNSGKNTDGPDEGISLTAKEKGKKKEKSRKDLSKVKCSCCN
jgi:hypothetical protein